MSKVNRCPRCGRKLSPSDVEGYSFVCYRCDENFYDFEAVESKSETGFRCPKCGNADSFDASCVVVMGTIHIAPDGWNYWDYSNDVTLDDGAVIECCECGHDDIPERFYDGFYD